VTSTPDTLGLIYLQVALLAPPFVIGLLRACIPLAFALRQTLPAISPCAIRNSASRNGPVISSVDVPLPCHIQNVPSRLRK
jgi:hypothetical protein